MKKVSQHAALAVVLVLTASTARAADDDPWTSFRFLIGTWITEGKPAGGTGRFSLEPDLGGKVLIRKNSADVPAAQGRPAAKHEDLMVIYREPGGKQFRASYFDNEGHVIAYAVSPLTEKQGLVLTSDAASAGPRFRLTYATAEAEKVAVKFEIAPPGKPDEFKTYLEGVVRRAKSGE